MNAAERAAKRLVDVVGAVAGLVIALPVIVLAALAVALTLGRPVFFRQERAGRGGKPFVLLKFRTMRTGRPGESDDERVTRVGWLLRASSIDELPQLWHVVRGEMSLVGPRPLPVRYLPRYSAEQRRRHEVRPGLTGWAQVNGRNAIDWAERLALDVHYVDHASLWLDLRILARTVVYLVSARGIHDSRGMITDEFRGTK